MDKIFKVLLWITIIIGTYFLSFYGTRFVNNRSLDGDEQVEYVASTQFDMYNPEYILVEEYSDGVETRLYEGVLDGRAGYVLVVKDIDQRYRYSFMLRSFRDIYARSTMYVQGTAYIPLHRQYYHHTTLIILYTYHDDKLQYYYSPNYYRDEDTIIQEANLVGNWSTPTDPQPEIYFNFLSFLGIIYMSSLIITEFRHIYLMHFDLKVKKADLSEL
jgi:hypothetical protein